MIKSSPTKRKFAETFAENTVRKPPGGYHRKKEIEEQGVKLFLAAGGLRQNWNI
jgi:hypothetical protein